MQECVCIINISSFIDAAVGMLLGSNINSWFKKEADRRLYNAFNLTQPLNGSLDCSAGEFLRNLV